MTLDELKVIISANTRDYESSLKKISSQTKTTTTTVETQANKMSSAFAKVAATSGSLAIGAKIISIGTSAIEAASDLTEVQNVVDTAFGDMAYKCEQFASTAIESFGMSEYSAKKISSTYMAMAKGMGLAEDTASDMAISLAGLAGDVASFYNIDLDTAETKLKSVFTGETESLKELGIVMTQTNLEQYALSQGISTSVSDMNQAQLTTLRYNYVLQQLSLASGDFAKTSGSWANHSY